MVSSVLKSENFQANWDKLVISGLSACVFAHTHTHILLYMPWYFGSVARKITLNPRLRKVYQLTIDAIFVFITFG